MQRQEHLSRADVSRLLGLNKVSTGEIVDLLLHERIITEEGSRTTTVGRRPIDLALNREYRMIIAIDAGTRNTSVALVNLAGEMLRYERFPTAQKPTAEEMAASMIHSTKKVLARMKDPATVCGLSISINGEVEPSLPEPYCTLLIGTGTQSRFPMRFLSICHFLSSLKTMSDRWFSENGGLPALIQKRPISM